MTMPPFDLQPSATDLHMGRQIRLRRLLLGITMEQLGHYVGLEHGAMALFERGAIRAFPSLLVRLARCLDVPILFFFDGLEPSAERDARLREIVSYVVRRTTKPSDAAAPPELGCASREEVALVRAFRRIADPDTRRRVLATVERLSGGSTT